MKETYTNERLTSACMYQIDKYIIYFLYIILLCKVLIYYIVNSY